MKIKNLIITFILLLVGSVFFGFGVSALTIQEDTIYFLDTNNWGEPYIYMYSTSNGNAFGWQDNAGKMTDTEEDICDTDGNCYNLYKYDVSSSYKGKYDMIVFSSKKAGKQTKDLYYVRTGTMFVTEKKNDSGNRDGQWYVYDKTELEELVKKAEKADSTKYTASSYNALKTPLEAANSALEQTFSTNFDSTHTKDVLVGWDGVTPYDTIVDNLKSAVEGLTLKNKVNVATPAYGNININEEWFEDNATVEFTVKPSDGYEIVSVSVTKVTGYDSDEKPILSTESESLNISDTGAYSYVIGTDDVYIDATFKLKEYTITTTIGELEGTIDPVGPVTVKHGEGKEFTITANDGYDVEKVTVNGKEYSLADGKLTLTNITEDMEIVVTFKLKLYTVIIDDVEYQISHGSKITELANYDSLIAKENYTFNGFLIKGTDEYFDVDTEIKEGIELTTSFTEIKKEEPEEDKDATDSAKPSIDADDKNVPNTGDSIIYTFIALIVSVITVMGLVIYKKKKMN